jgi:hypothetical protein
VLLLASVTRTPDPLNLEAAELVVPPLTLGARFTRTAMPCELGVDRVFTVREDG